MGNKLKIVFMGTPDFAVPALEALVREGYDILLVVTQPDRPKGRGKKLSPPPVKEKAEEYGIKVYQPENMKGEEQYETLKALNPDAFVVVAYGHILPVRILEIPRLGPINIHASLLPKYRGAAPIQWSIINGDKKTGITTMFMEKGMDTGAMLLQDETEITAEDTSESLHDRLSEMGARLVVKTLEGLEKGVIKPVAQDHEKATLAPMLKKELGRIKWSESASVIDCLIRGVTPWPGAFTEFEGAVYKIITAKPVSLGKSDATPGEVVSDSRSELVIAAGDGAISITQIQGASGKRLAIRDFLAGNRIPKGAVFI